LGSARDVRKKGSCAFGVGGCQRLFALCASYHASHHLFASKVDSTGLGSANLMEQQFLSRRRQYSVQYGGVLCFQGRVDWTGLRESHGAPVLLPSLTKFGGQYGGVQISTLIRSSLRSPHL
jgi:hypothetical protein